MRSLLIAVALLISADRALAEQQPEKPVVLKQDTDKRHFEGTWNTVRNIKLNGRMDCYSVNRGNSWRGRFTGVWQGQKFEYVVDWTGPPDNLVGKQVNIDGARYKWTGKIVNGRFTGEFESFRYKGSFDLKEKPVQ